MRFVIPTDDENLGRMFFLKGGRSELSTVRRAEAHLRKFGAWRGSTLVDVGANIGTTTVCGLVAGTFGSAVAIEPAPKNLRLLKANLALNDLLDRVTVVAAAAGDAEGEAFLQLSDHNVGAHQIADEGLPVRLVTIQSLAVDPDDVALLWMDVQGHEGHVLAGAGGLIDAGVPYVLEYYPNLLRKAGRWDTICETFERYEFVIDLRTKKPEPIAAREATDRVPEMLAERDARYTDLLVFRTR
jgi:FkbM family methyltransferase